MSGDVLTVKRFQFEVKAGASIDHEFVRCDHPWGAADTAMFNVRYESSSSSGGTYAVLVNNAGISSMHTAVTHKGTVIMLDRTNAGPSAILLPNGECRDQPLEQISKNDCYAHSVMFNQSNIVRPLYIFTDTWCSSGQFIDNGTMVQTGGDFEGNKKIRTLDPCSEDGSCDWEELGEELAFGRWYSSNQLLPAGGRQIIVGGRSTPNYEFYPKREVGEGAFYLAMLGGDDALYPFVFLLPNGDLYIFASRNSVNLNWNTDRVTKIFPQIPDNPRNYPSAGSAAMLPLTWQNNFAVAEIMVCGGAATGAANSNDVTAPASASCGRIVATAGDAYWAMQDMPIRRTMGDMLNMPTGDILIINGAQNGFQGWEKATNPAFEPVSYNPNTKEFQIYAPATIPRLYHATANLLADGRVMLAGSNTHQFYTYTGQYPTELRVEAFSPPYLAPRFSKLRPAIRTYPKTIKYKQVFAVTFEVGIRQGMVEVNQNSSPFVTHSYAQGQRQLKLKTTVPVRVGRIWSVQVTATPGNTIAPPAYYMVFLVQGGIPSTAVWVKQTI